MTTRTWLDGTANWATAADWSGGVIPGPNDDAVIKTGAPNVTAAISVHSITDDGGLVFTNAGGSSIGGDAAIGSNGYLLLDGTANAGGSTISVSGTLTVKGQLSIGNATSSDYATFSTAALVNTGSITLDGAASEATYLGVQGAAGFGTAGVLSGTVSLSGSSVLRFSSGSIRTVASGGTLTLNGSSAFVADSGSTASNSALTGLAAIATRGTVQLRNGAAVAAGASLVNYGTFGLDTTSGDGGSGLSVATKLGNAGTLQIGNAGLSAAASVSVQSLANRGMLTLTGNGANQALLNITGGSASLGVKGTITGTVTLAGTSLLEAAYGQFTTIAHGSALTLNGANAYVADEGKLASNSALAGLRLNRGVFTLQGGAAVSVSSYLLNSGTLELGSSFDHVGASLTIPTTLYNSGSVDLGSDESDMGQTRLSVQRLVNTGSLSLGDPYGPHYTLNARIVVSGSAGFGATGTVTGSVEISGGGVISFASGGISDIKADAFLRLDRGFLALASDLAHNSALTGLRQNEGQFYIDDFGEVVATTTAFTNSGKVYLADGGTFSTASTLTNSGTLQVGFRGETFDNTGITVQRLRNSGHINLEGSENGMSPYDLQSLTVHSAAGTGTTGVLTGDIDLSGNALLQFDSGQIGTIEGTLGLESAYARVADAGSTNTSSALTGLRTVSGTLSLDNGAQVQVTSALGITGELDVDLLTGGSSLTVGTTLDNEGTVTIGNAALTASDTVTAHSMVNHGLLSMTGFGADQALLSLASAAGFGTTGTVTGDIDLSGNAVIQFASGALTSIATYASLTLEGADAGVTAAGNNALTALQTIDGTFAMRDGASLGSSGNITLTGFLDLDQKDGGRGSVLSIGGSVDNEGYFRVGNADLTSADDLAVTGLINNGTVTLTGGATGLAEVYVGSAAGFGTTGELTGDVSLTGNAVLMFKSGSIDTIDAGASLSLDGSNARIAVTGSMASNSALTGLSEIDGLLDLRNGSNVQTGSLTNYGLLNLDVAGGGSLLSVSDRFDNENVVTLGGQFSSGSLSASDSLTAGSLLNNGDMRLFGNGPSHAQLTIAGTTVNSGTMAFTSDSQTFTGGIYGTGTMYLYAGTALEFDYGVVASQTVAYGGADKLVLGNAKTFAGTIAGFAVSDTIDLKHFAAGSSLSYAGDTSSGVLSITSGTSVAQLHFAGNFTTASFAGASDGAGGLLLSHA